MDKKKILVVVDYQKDFVDGTLGFAGAEKLDEGITNEIKRYMDNGDIVIMTKDTHGTYAPYEATREGKALTVPHCIYQSEGWQFYEKTRDTFFEYEKVGANTNGHLFVINKPTFGMMASDIVGALFSQFSKNDIDLSPVGCSIEEVRFVGLVTDICVLSNIAVFQGLLPEAQMVLDAKLTASFDRVQYLKALDIAERSWQVRVENRPHIYVAADMREIPSAGSVIVTEMKSLEDACYQVGVMTGRGLASLAFISESNLDTVSHLTIEEMATSVVYYIH